MEQRSSFSEYLFGLASVFASPDVLLQAGVLALAFVGAWWLHRRVVMVVTQTPASAGGARELVMHGAKRVAFALAAFLLVLIGRGVLLQSDLPVGLLNVAVPLLLSLALIRALAFVLRKTIAPDRGVKAWENVIAATVWLVVALHLLGWLPDVVNWMDRVGFSVGQARVSLLLVLKFALSASLLLLLALWIAHQLERKLQQSTQLDAGVRIGLAKLGKFTLLALALVIALNSVGIDLTALTVFGGALGVGLGLGLQRIASNLVSGFILVFERSIRPGDVVTVGSSFGQVKELHARYVVVRSRDGVDTLIPNENLITGDVINWSYGDRQVRVKIPVQISYGDDPERAMQLMLDAARAHPRVLADPAPACLLTAFGDNGINLELRVWINDPEEGVTNVRSHVNLAVWRAFRDNNITIPFPQRDVHVKTRMSAGFSGNER